jgi:hypothetical protein
MAAAMDGLDVLVFTGGIGEHQPLIRSRAAPAFLGVLLDERRNEAAAADADIGAAGAPAAALVVTSREDIEIARQVRALLSGSDQAPHRGNGRNLRAAFGVSAWLSWLVRAGGGGGGGRGDGDGAGLVMW